VSLGDFVLSGGEIAALALLDAARLLPGVMGKEASGPRRVSEGLLEYPQHPAAAGRAHPSEVLCRGPAKVAAWRREQAERLTRERRPDLWAGRPNPRKIKGVTDG
jgi:tRNA (guanine37-N1)-methyltransferase